MAWTDPPSYTNGQIITQTDLHVGLRDNMRELWHEKAYVEFSATVSSSSATPIDVVSAGAVTYINAPIFVEFFSPGVTVAGGTGLLMLYQDGVTLAALMTPGIGGTGGTKRLTPTAGSHTYKVMINGTGGGATSSAYADASSTGFIRILQRGA